MNWEGGPILADANWTRQDSRSDAMEVIGQIDLRIGSHRHCMGTTDSEDDDAEPAFTGHRVSKGKRCEHNTDSYNDK